MIYIFEDRFERRRNNQDTINRYSDIVTFAQFDIKPQQNLTDFVVDKFCDADCILFHKSYSLTSSNVSMNNIKETFSGYLEAKFILFSGGIERGSIRDNGEISINADVMYENLDLFLKKFKESGELIYEILIWGKNYNLNRHLSQQVRVHNNSFLESDLSEPIAKNYLEDLIDDIETEGFDIAEAVKQRADLSAGIITWEDVLNIVQSKIG